jgi:hypothetical protein
MTDERKCHLCNGPTKDKYCVNETCAEFIRDEKEDLLEVTDLDQEVIADLILKGFTSGIQDYEEENGLWVRMERNLKNNKLYPN